MEWFTLKAHIIFYRQLRNNLAKMNDTLEFATSIPNNQNFSSAVGEYLDLSTFWFSSLIVFYCLFSFGTILDIFVIYVMLRSGQLRKNFSSFLIFHLSLTHFLFHLLFAMNFTRRFSRRDPVMCKVSIFIEHACPAAIFGTLVAIAWERQKNILQPFKSLISTPLKSYVLMVTAIWVYAVSSSISFAPSVTVRPIEFCQEVNRTQKCEEYVLCDRPTGTWQILLSQTVYTIVAFFIPLIYMIVAYTRVAVRLWKRSKNGAIHSAVAKHKSKSIRLLVFAVLGFVLCWGPSILFNFLDECRVLEGLQPDLKLLSRIWLTFIAPASSSWVNTAVYALFCPEFRKNSVKFACCCCCCCFRSRRIVSSNHRVSPDEIRMTRTRQTSIGQRQNALQ